MYVGFMCLEKAYVRINMELLWHVLRIHDVGGNLLNHIKSMYVNNLARVRAKGDEGEFSELIVV